MFPQIKYLWHNSKHNNKEINSSAVIGFNYKTNDGSGIYGSYFYVPTTIVMNKFLNLSFDLGLQRWNDVNNNTSFLIGGAALEFRVSEKSVLIAEIFRNSNKHSLQVGNKFSSSAITGGQFGLRNFYSKNFIFDVIYGKDIIGDGSSNWITGGLTILFE